MSLYEINPAWSQGARDLKVFYTQITNCKNKHLIHSVSFICQLKYEIEPKYSMKIKSTPLIKSTAPSERLNIDFKGPIPANTRNRYIC